MSLLQMFTDKNALPSRLPVGLDEFHTWADSVIALTPLPNNESIKFALATIILELGPTMGFMSKVELSHMLIKAAANQVAAYYFQSIKLKRMEEDEAAKRLKALEESNVATVTSINDPVRI